MHELSWLFERLKGIDTAKEAVIQENKAATYGELIDKIGMLYSSILSQGITGGETVGLATDFSMGSISLLMALIKNSNIIVPVANSPQRKREFFEEADVSREAVILENGELNFTDTGRNPKNRMIIDFSKQIRPGIVLFTSGTTGKSKGVLHDLTRLLRKFQNTVHASLRTIPFMFFDHIGGLDTLFDVLLNGGTVVTVRNRDPYSVCRAIEKYGIELLPTTPSFLNLLLLSKEYQKHDLSSLKIITYGAEPIMDSVLMKLNEQFPHVKIIQKYGLTETGSFRTKNRSKDSKWIKMNDGSLKTKIIDSKLYIKTESSMIGYLNEENPFDEEGFYPTGDLVEVDGEYFKILGRESDVINVGGEKVLPLEVENVIYEMPEISEVVVYGKNNPILGKIVAADVLITSEITKNEIKKRIRAHCRKKLEEYKIPVEVNFMESYGQSSVIKKTRNKKDT
ncbi:long-chain fatty acid--CoA ligase [candidate division WOR-3 bacterium]|nr:long-chain fatty acid--CoA ligase [candidate division WOR-3 bacterium]